MTHTADAPEVLWRPEPSHVADTQIEAFRQWLREERAERTSTTMLLFTSGR